MQSPNRSIIVTLAQTRHDIASSMSVATLCGRTIAQYTVPTAQTFTARLIHHHTLNTRLLASLSEQARLTRANTFGRAVRSTIVL
jgi:hypothetical protein